MIKIKHCTICKCTQISNGLPNSYCNKHGCKCEVLERDLMKEISVKIGHRPMILDWALIGVFLDYNGVLEKIVLEKDGVMVDFKR